MLDLYSRFGARKFPVRTVWLNNSFFDTMLFIFFGIPPWIFLPKGQNRMPAIACDTSMFASPSSYRRCKGLAKNWHHRHHEWLRTCVYYMYHGNTVIIGGDDREEMVSVWRTDGTIRNSLVELPIDCLQLPYRPSLLLLPFVHLLFPLPPNINPNSTTTSLIKKSVPASSSNSISSKKREGRIYTPKVILRRTYQALEPSGEAKGWVRDVGEGDDAEME